MRRKQFLSFLLAVSMILSLLPVAAFAEEIDEQPAHEHSYVASETVDATCTEQGYTVYTCECGESYTEYTEALGHAWSEGVVTIEPTTEAEGEMTYTCSRCGEVKTEAIAVLQPEDSDDPAGESEDPEKKDEDEKKDKDAEDPDKKDENAEKKDENAENKDEDAEKKDEEDSAELKAAEATAPTSMWIAPSELNGLPQGENVRIDLFKRSGNNYELYLPGTASAENFFFSWDGDMQATVTINGQTKTYANGECPVPTPNNNYNSNTGLTYTFKNGNRTLATFIVKAYQGSGSVQKVFIVIDESKGTIQAMDSDKNNTCSGDIYINGAKYTLSKMKGRGNATWDFAQDKKPYNITLGSKINFPGISSEKTKKWSFLAEVTDHSLLCNRVGLYLANAMGIGYDTTSADVWMNGEYQGCYTVTPKTDSYVTDDGFMIEQDNYQEPAGGDPQFKLDGLTSSIEGDHSSSYNLITVKDIGDGLLNGSDAETVATGTIKPWLQTAWDAIRSKDGISDNKKYTDYIDIESFAKMFLVHEYIKSYDVCAGSILFHRDGKTDDYKLIAGPAWDMDNALGATCSDNNLGNNVDRRSGEGKFIENIKEYKTSIYKTIYKHVDFQQEVILQYNLNKSVFDSLPGVVDELKTEIFNSAKMNHIKVNDITGNYMNSKYANTHKYSNNTSVGSGQYSQSYLATTNSKTDWENYAANLRTYVNTRSLWFKNTYTDDSYVDPSTCTHVYEEISNIPATCTSTGLITRKCTKCRDVKTESIPKIAHDYQDGACVVCGEKLITVDILCDECSSVTVYETQDINGTHVDNAVVAYPRNSDTGLIDCQEGAGQVNFVVNVAPGYEIDSVTAEPAASYKNLKGPKDTGISNGYRITKVKGNFTIKVTTKKEPPKFAQFNLLLASEIGVQFKLKLPEGFDATDSYMSFEVSDGKTSSMQITDAAKVDGENAYWFTCYVNALELADTITATYYYGTGEKIESTYSALTYIEAAKAQYPDREKLINLVNALQDYGHYLQESGWTDNRTHTSISAISILDNDSITAAREGVEGKTAVLDLGDSGIERMKFALTLNAQTVINVFAKPGNGVTITGSNGKPKGTRTIGGEVYYQYDTEKIGAGSLGKPYTITVTTSSGGTATIQASAMSYVNVVLNNSSFTQEKQLAMAAYYNYYAAADAYKQN